MDILMWLVFGLVVGVVAKFVMPGQDAGGIVLTIGLGIAGALLGGWLGGELVERLGVGVDPDANLNAPNSLTRSARETKKRMSDAQSY